MHCPAASIEFLPQNEQAKDVAKIATEFFSSSMRDLAPDTGAYMNEVGREPRPVRPMGEAKCVGRAFAGC